MSGGGGGNVCVCGGGGVGGGAFSGHERCILIANTILGIPYLTSRKANIIIRNTEEAV